MTGSKSETTDHLAILRKRYGYTQRQVAGFLNCSEVQMRRYEQGAVPDLKTSLKLELLYGLRVQSIFAELYRQLRRQLKSKLDAFQDRRFPKYSPAGSRITLALDPWTRAIGAAVMEGEQLLRCRVRYLKGRFPERLQVKGRAFVEEMIRTFKPKILVLPKTDYPQSKRSRHVQVFCKTIKELGLRTKLRVVEYRREEIQRSLGIPGRFNRHRVAVAVAKQFPELASKLPPPRKFYKPQDLRISAFYAAALTRAAIQRSTKSLNQTTGVK